MQVAGILCRFTTIASRAVEAEAARERAGAPAEGAGPVVGGPTGLWSVRTRGG